MKANLRVLGLVIVLCLCALVQVVRGGENRVVVQPFGTPSEDSELMALSEGFSDLLSATLSTYDEIEVVEREHLHRVVLELGYRLSGLQEDNYKKIGSLLQANRFITGGFVHVSGKLRINIHVYDVETTQLLTSLAREGELTNVDQLAMNLGEALALTLIEGKQAAKAALTTDHPVINLHYMKGLGAFYGGLYDHAIAEFMQVLDIDPAHANARYWLAKSYLDGGEKAHAMIEFKRFVEAFPSEHRAAEIKKMFPDL